jgi:SAM-dependent methyltransferase
MTGVFGPTYSKSYDLLYHDKDYTHECDLIERIFQSYATTKIKSILDFGCGTGGHSIILAQRGYELYCVDRSQHMLSVAKRKAHEIGQSITFHQADIVSVDLGEKYDACICMFTVLGYQLNNADVESTMRTVRKHLKPGGLFIFDFWYGPAVINIKPSQRIKTLNKNATQLIRIANPKIDFRNHTIEITYTLMLIKDNVVVEQTAEEHTVRYFFPLELERFLSASDFVLEHLWSFNEFDRDPDATTWNVLAVVRANQ